MERLRILKTLREQNGKNINSNEKKRYLLNSYRVLLTRARQWMVIFIPEGDISDRTMHPNYYESVYQYFVQCGVPTIVSNPH